MEMMDKLDSLNNGMLNHKKKFQKNINQNKILIQKMKYIYLDIRYQKLGLFKIKK